MKSSSLLKSAIDYFVSSRYSISTTILLLLLLYIPIPILILIPILVIIIYNKPKQFFILNLYKIIRTKYISVLIQYLMVI